MKVLFDTSILVAALVEPHPRHTQALSWLRRGKEKEIDIFLASHTIAELYAVLSTLPVSPRITSGLAWRLIHDSVEPLVSIVSLSTSDYLMTVKRMSELGIFGGAIYDALIVKAAQKSGADSVLTFNASDFKRIWPEEAARIITP
jgi:predicted nucleic acid-binding protein